MVPQNESIAMVRGFIGLAEQYAAESTWEDTMTAMIAALAVVANRDGGSEAVRFAADCLIRCPTEVVEDMIAEPVVMR